MEELFATPRARGERRVKLLKLDPRHILDLFNAGSAACLAVPRLDGVPQGTEVLGVQAEWLPHCISLLLYHPSWPEVRPGEIPPRVDASFRLEMLRIVRDAGGEAARLRRELEEVYAMLEPGHARAVAAALRGLQTPPGPDRPAYVTLRE